MEDFVKKYSKWFPYCEEEKLKKEMLLDLKALAQKSDASENTLPIADVSDYYTLKNGDIIVKGDEFYDYDEGGIWFEAQKTGQEFDSETMYKFRRKI